MKNTMHLEEDYPLEGVKTAGEETKQGWLESLAALGCERAVFG